MLINEAKNHREGIITLLSLEKLPADDLPETFENFLVAVQDDELIGVIGLEIYGYHGLLRSLVVKPPFRGQNIAGNLMEQIETLAASKKLKAIFLLTETAPDYFIRKGYQKTTRNDVPDEIQQSSEFSHVCPQSAIVMKKEIPN